MFLLALLEKGRALKECCFKMVSLQLYEYQRRITKQE